MKTLATVFFWAGFVAWMLFWAYWYGQHADPKRVFGPWPSELPPPPRKVLIAFFAWMAVVFFLSRVVS